MKEQLEASVRVRQVDLAKCFAIIGVLLIHASGEGLFYLEIGSRPWMQSLFWGSISRFAVPLFFLCSGALLLGDARKVTTRHVWTRSIPHMLAALFFWALLYRLVPVLRQGTMEKTELLRAISDVFCWRHEQHLYYLHILLLVYAALPVTRIFAQGRRKNDPLCACALGVFQCSASDSKGAWTSFLAGRDSGAVGAFFDMVQHRLYSAWLAATEKAPSRRNFDCTRSARLCNLLCRNGGAFHPERHACAAAS